MNSEVIVREFEWYLRDYFFKINKDKNEQELTKEFKKEEILNALLKIYLRYRNSDPNQIRELLNTVSSSMHKNDILFTNSENINIYSNLDRKQCVQCYYINYLFKNEPIKCSKCNSKILREFPAPKKLNKENNNLS